MTVELVCLLLSVSVCFGVFNYVDVLNVWNQGNKGTAAN